MKIQDAVPSLRLLVDPDRCATGEWRSHIGGQVIHVWPEGLVSILDALGHIGDAIAGNDDTWGGPSINGREQRCIKNKGRAIDEIALYHGIAHAG